MTILAECPLCHRKQSVKNKTCQKKGCDCDLNRAKRSKAVKYHIVYRLNGKQHKEYVSTSIEEARDALGKRRSQKRENRIFDILPESKMTFAELADWYLELPKRKKLRSFNRLKIGINRFLARFGNTVVGDLRNSDLEEYQEARTEQGAAEATIDYEISVTRTMIEKAIVNDKVGIQILKAFKKTERKLKRGANARKKVVSPDEFNRVFKEAPRHMQNIMAVALLTGMRSGEIRCLTWPMVDLQTGFLRLPETLTKEKKSKAIPIGDHLRGILESVRPELSLVSERHHNFVFTYRGVPIRSPGGLRRSFKHACDKAGIPFGQDTEGGLVIKDLRRTAKTLMAETGINKVHRDTLLGHSLRGMDVHYIVPTDATLIEAMQKYENFVLEKYFPQSVAQTLPKTEKRLHREV